MMWSIPTIGWSPASFERRWNEKLVQLRDLEVQLEALAHTKDTPALSAEDRAKLMNLAGT